MLNSQPPFIDLGLPGTNVITIATYVIQPNLYQYYVCYTQVGDWHAALVTIVGEVVSLRIDNNLLQLTDTLSCTPLYPDYDLPMIVGAGMLGEIDTVIINFVPVALNKKCDYTIPVNVSIEFIYFYLFF